MAENPNDNQGMNDKFMNSIVEDMETPEGHVIKEFEENNQCLVDIANNTFRELCKTLESEQTKLRELEARRLKLQEEVDVLKQEVEQEKLLYSMTLSEFADGEVVGVVDESDGATIPCSLDQEVEELIIPLGLEITEITDVEDAGSHSSLPQSKYPNDDETKKE